jgi:hypothetical protein
MQLPQTRTPAAKVSHTPGSSIINLVPEELYDLKVPEISTEVSDRAEAFIGDLVPREVHHLQFGQTPFLKESLRRQRSESVAQQISVSQA